MKNGIIINGITYEAVVSDTPQKKCDKCGLRLECFDIGRLCGLFFPDSALHYYFKTIKEDAK